MIDKKIKILFITNALEVGGAEKFLLDLLKHLDKDQFEPIVATVIGGGSLEKDLAQLNLPVFIHGKKRIRYLGGLKQFWQLYKLIKKIKPDIVHTQLFASDLWGRLAGWLAQVPIIITTEQNVNIDQSWLRETLKKWTYKLANKTVAISTAVKNYAQKRYGLKDDQIIIIPNDVDINYLEQRMQQAPPPPTDKKIILNTGRLVVQKGQKYLLEAFALLPQPHNYELWIAGDGILKNSLIKQAQDLGLTDKVKFLGTRHDIPELLSQAHLFVFSSVFEGLGIAVLEAIAGKVPVVATNIDGLTDIIKNEESGLLVEPKNSSALAKAMNQMLTDETFAKQMADNAYNQVKNNFDITVVVKKYEKLFKEMINAK